VPRGRSSFGSNIKRAGRDVSDVIDVCAVARRYRLDRLDITALRGVDLRIAYGEFVAIMGASGSGKSTLMHILGCLDRPSSGGYRFEGRAIADLSDVDLAAIRSRRIGFVFQNFNLLQRRSAQANVALPMLYAGQAVLGDDHLERAAKALQSVGLASHLRHHPNQLSGGQQQRVALARALINDPAVLLADEPTGNLDSATSGEIMSMIQRLNRDHGLTVVVVTHETDVAAYADRVVTLRDGLIESDIGGDRRRHPPHDAGPDPTRTARKPGAGVSWSLLTMTMATAFAALSCNKLRAALTMLGVFIGVAALIAMIELGDGANDAVRKQIASLGTSMLVVLPGASTANGVRAGSSSASSLTVADAEALPRDDFDVARVSYIDRQVGQVQFGNQNWSTAIQGVTPAYLRIVNWHLASGRALTRADDEAAMMVCLIGQTVYRKLFSPDQDPVGETMLVNGKPLRIVGLLASRGQSSFGTDQDDIVLLPFATAEQRVIGVATPLQAPSPVAAQFPPAPNPFGLRPKFTGMVNLVLVQARSAERVDDAMHEVAATLQRRHLIRPGAPDDFSVRNLSQIASAASNTSRAIALLLAILASISLIVGGVGIMNILLVSVTERTREIGVRMALGARRSHVLLQFLAEAALLSCIGGVIGLGAGVTISSSIARLAGWPIEISPVAIVGSVLFSAVIGVFFGYYPALRAARLNPIEALRYE
jgi:macrolide transport system ATP-binding/permease protein